MAADSAVQIGFSIIRDAGLAEILPVHNTEGTTGIADLDPVIKPGDPNRHIGIFIRYVP